MRAAAVSHVIALDPIDSPSLRLERVVAPARVSPVAIRVYRVIRPLPRAAVARFVIPAPADGTRASPTDDETVLLEGTVAAEDGARGHVVRMTRGGRWPRR